MNFSTEDLTRTSPENANDDARQKPSTASAPASGKSENLPNSVIFQIENAFYAFAVANVLEISYPLPTTRLPLTPAWLLGIVNLRGDIVPVVDFLRFIGRQPRQAAASKSKMIVLVSRRDETKVGLIVDQVREIQHVPPHSVVAPPQNLEPHLEYFMLGTAAHKSNVVNMLDAEKFFASPYMRTLT